MSSREQARGELLGEIFRYRLEVAPRGSPLVSGRASKVEAAIQRLEQAVETEVRSEYEPHGDSA